MQYPGSVVEDAKLLSGYAEEAIVALGKTFAEINGEELIRTAGLVILVHESPTDQASEDTVTLFSGAKDDHYFAEVHFLAPSRHQTDRAKDMLYFRRVMVHELSTIIFERYSRAKKIGWRFSSAPNWFVQGIEQYYAFLLADPEGLIGYIGKVKADPQIVSTDFGLEVREPYVGGAVLVTCIIELRGKDAVHRIIASSQPTFGGALREELGTGVDAFGIAFQDWLAKNRK